MSIYDGTGCQVQAETDSYGPVGEGASIYAVYNEKALNAQYSCCCGKRLPAFRCCIWLGGGAFVTVVFVAAVILSLA